MQPREYVALKKPITRFFCSAVALPAIIFCKTGTLTEYPAYTRTLNSTKIPTEKGRAVPKAAREQTVIRSVRERFTLVLLIIHTQSVILETKDTNPTPALMIPL